MVSVPGFYESEKFRRKSAQSADEESRPDMAEENQYGDFVPDMELRKVGEIEKENLKVNMPTSQILRASRDSDVTNKEGCTRRTISFSENSGMARDTHSQYEHEDLFSAKLQEIDKEIDMFEGRKRGLNTADSEVQSNMP